MSKAVNKSIKPNSQASGLPETSRSLPIALARAREKVMLPIRQMLSASGITEQQWRVLRVLYEQGPLDSTTLADEACLLMPSLTRIVQSMVQNGYVTRTEHEEDRRRQTVAIAPKGKAIINNNLDEATAIAAHIEATLGKKRFDDLLDSLRRLDEM